MRTTSALGALVIGATSALVGLAPAAVAGGSTTEHQRGIVLECTGSTAAHSAYVDLYENDKHGNYAQVVLDGRPALSASREPQDIWSDGAIRTGVTIKGKRAVVVGTAHKSGPRTPVHETHDDGGNHIVADGFHRRLANDLVLRNDGHRILLTCQPAFFYSLDVTTTPIG
jgi:hypothetical protein